MIDKTFWNDLIKRISEGDQQAFRLFFEDQYPRVNRFVSYLVNSRELKEEVVSDVFFTIWQQRKRLCDVENFNALLFTIARNRSLDYLRRSIHLKSIDEIPLTIASLENSPEDDLINEELRLVITRAVDTLPEKCKLVFLMAKEQGLKYREIADVLQISEKTVNAQMVIALKKLNAALQKYMKFIFFCFPAGAL